LRRGPARRDDADHFAFFSLTVAHQEESGVRALDGLLFHLYGLAEDDTAYILDTFPIVREQDQAAFGRYRTKDDTLAQLRSITGGSLRVAPAA
jgi:hypothetical protein